MGVQPCLHPETAGKQTNKEEKTKQKILVDYPLSIEPSVPYRSEQGTGSADTCVRQLVLKIHQLGHVMETTIVHMVTSQVGEQHTGDRFTIALTW